VLVDFLTVGGSVQVQVQDRHGHVRGRHADGVAAQLAAQLRKRLGHGLGSTGLGDHHVQGSTATTAVTLVEVVDQILVVGIGVNRFNVAILDTELVVDCLEHRHNGVGGAGSRGNDLVFRGDPAVVDAVHDVLQVALARSSQQHLADTVTLEVLGQARLVAPDTGVVHQQCVLDAIGGIIHSARVAGVDELNPGAVGGQRVVLFVDGDGALERTMHRVAAQQTGALGQVVLGTLAHHNRPQTQPITRTGLFNQNACQQTTDATEAIENHITTLALLALATDDTGQLATQEGVQITGALLLELDYQTGQIDGSRAQIQVHQRLDDRVGVVHGQLIVINLASKAMGLEQADYRTVARRAALTGGD